jgi:hypothetical protein
MTDEMQERKAEELDRALKYMSYFDLFAADD